MLRRVLLLLAAAPLCLPSVEARAQVGIRPDPMPRLPPQPGQAPPIDDVRFLRNAALLSAAQVEAAQAFSGQQGDEEARQLAARLAERHRGLAEELAGLAQERNVEPVIPALDAPEGDVAAALRQLEEIKGATAPDARAFLEAQLQVHRVLVEMYQTEASHTSDYPLGGFAIKAMVGLQEDFSAVAQLGERHGLAPSERLLANPPQYGPGAGPTR